MPVTFNKDGSGKRMIHTKIVGVKGSCQIATLNDKSGNSWNLEYRVVENIAKNETTPKFKVIQGTAIILMVNGEIYDRKTMGKSMFSVIDYGAHLMMSRQKILKYMYLYPERVINVFRKPGLEGEIQAKIEINNYDESVFEFTCTLGNIEMDDYMTELQKPHKLNEWMITGIEKNHADARFNLGCNIGIELFDI